MEFYIKKKVKTRKSLGWSDCTAIWVVQKWWLDRKFRGSKKVDELMQKKNNDVKLLEDSWKEVENLIRSWKFR